MRLPQRLRRLEECCTIWREEPDPGIPLDAVMATSYWVHVHDKITVNDIFVISPQDKSYFVVFEVLMKRPGELKFRKLFHFEDVASAQSPLPAAASTFILQFVPALQWTVVERSTGKRVVQGMDKPSALAECDRLNAGDAIAAKAA